jgi:hypothetical protein
MIYKNHQIVAEVITKSSLYSLDENGQLDEEQSDIHSEPRIVYYGVVYSDSDDDDVIDWFDTLGKAKEEIDFIEK